jgi:hypothetical protein
LAEAFVLTAALAMVAWPNALIDPAKMMIKVRRVIVLVFTNFIISSSAFEGLSSVRSSAVTIAQV